MDDIELHRTTSICCAVVIVVALAMMCHESAHVMCGILVGGDPSLLTATEVKGDFDSLTPLGFVVFGASGSCANLLLCGLGWLLLKWRNASSEFQLTAWFLFAFNGFIVTTKMMVEPIVGFGDWMTVVRHLPFEIFLRALIVIVGTGGLILLVRQTGHALGTITSACGPSSRTAAANRIVLVGALASAVLVLASSVASPVGIFRGTLLALGGGLAPFVPMLFATRIARRTMIQTAAPPFNGSIAWYISAVALAFVMCVIFGPGITL